MFAKRLLYLTEAQLAAYRWRAGRLSEPRLFPANAEGHAAFAAHLAETPNDAVYVLADVIEEDFRAETVPHVFGKDRRALVQRKLGQHFRNTPYRHAAFQGRESAGRRDDRILFTALTNEETLKPWLNALAERQAPVAGIYSVPLLSRQLIQKLGLDGVHHLLVTRHAFTGLRQSYFQQDQLKFSRLTLLAPDEPLTPAETIARESGRTQQYLNSLRLLPREEALAVNVIAAEADLPLLRQACRDTPQLHFNFLGLAEVAATLGVKPEAADLYPELLFLHLLGRNPGRQPYATAGETRCNQLRLARLAMIGVTLMVTTSALAVSALELSRGMDHYRQEEQLTREASGVQTRVQAVRQRFPSVPTTTENMKAAVEVVDAIAGQDARPEHLLALISQAVANLPQIRIDRVDWRLSSQLPETAPAGANGAPPPPAISQKEDAKELPVLGTKDHPLYQLALIHGQVALSQGHRAALADIDRLVEDLRAKPGIDATAIALPLDVSSGTRLAGTANGSDQPSGFTVRVVMKP